MPEQHQSIGSGQRFALPSICRSKSFYVIMWVGVIALFLLWQQDVLETALASFLVAEKVRQFTDLERWIAEKTSDPNLRLVLLEDVLKKISQNAAARPMIELDLARQYIISGQPESALEHAGKCLSSLSMSKTDELDAQTVISSIENLLASYPASSLQNQRIALLAQTLEELLRNRAGAVRAKQVALVLLDQVRFANKSCNAMPLHEAAIAVTKLLKQRVITWSNAELKRFYGLCDLVTADDAEQLYRAEISNHGTSDLEIGSAEIKLLSELRSANPSQAHGYLESLLTSSAGEMSAHRISVLKAAISMALSDGKSDQAESFVSQIRQLSPECGSEIKELEARVAESKRKKPVTDTFRI